MWFFIVGEWHAAEQWPKCSSENATERLAQASVERHPSLLSAHSQDMSPPLHPVTRPLLHLPHPCLHHSPPTLPRAPQTCRHRRPGGMKRARGSGHSWRTTCKEMEPTTSICSSQARGSAASARGAALRRELWRGLVALVSTALERLARDPRRRRNWGDLADADSETAFCGYDDETSERWQKETAQALLQHNNHVGNGVAEAALRIDEIWRISCQGRWSIRRLHGCCAESLITWRRAAHVSVPYIDPRLRGLGAWSHELKPLTTHTFYEALERAPSTALPPLLS